MVYGMKHTKHALQSMRRWSSEELVPIAVALAFTVGYVLVVIAIVHAYHAQVMGY
jgi:hypothetical protein